MANRDHDGAYSILRPASLFSAIKGDAREESLSRLVESDGGTAEHAISVRFAGSQDEAAERLRLIWADARHSLPEARMWMVRSAVAPQSDRAHAYVETELKLPLSGRAACRIVLIGYNASVVDVIITVDRRQLGQRALLQLALALRGPDAPTEASRPVVGDSNGALELPNHLPAPSEIAVLPGDRWGLGGEAPARGQGTLIGSSFDGAADAQTVLAAIALTLGRFRGGGRSLVACLIDGMPEGLALVALPDPAGQSIADFSASCSDRAHAIAWHTAEVEIEARARNLPIEACLWFDPAAPEPMRAEGIAHRHYCDQAYPLSIAIERDGRGGYRLRYGFDRSLYHETLIANFDRAIATVCVQLAELATGGLARVDDIQLVEAEGARPSSIGAAMRPDAGVTPTSLVAELHRVVENQPEAPAISFEDQTMSYRELAEVSSRFSRGLRSHGVKPGDRVGIYTERSLELVPLFVAILKCGATYVPIEPSAAFERQQYIMQDAGIRILIAGSSDLTVIPGIMIVLPDDLAAAGSRKCDIESCDGVACPAYIIYTSGSTGRPKGVLIAQQSVLALIQGLSTDLALSPDDRWTLFHSAAFDFATWEIWGCLLTGGQLFVVPYLVSRSPEEFLNLLSERGVTVLNQTPTAFASLQAVDQAQRPPLSLRLLVFGGETLDAPSLLPWMTRHPTTECRLVNMYGITETTVHVTAETVTRHHALSGSRSVGAPIPGWWVRIKDSAGRDLPSGLAGEIYVGGSGLAVGYINKEAENRTRFILDDRTGERMYRSGDRGRLHADGRLDHLGRLDNQVKLRGFRIELDEIRLVALEIDGVDAAQIVFRDTDAGRSEEAALEAFIVSANRPSSEIRSELRNRLPDYMVPARIHILESLPLTPNGKFDVIAATKAAESYAEIERTGTVDDWSALITEGTDVAQAIASLWGQVFGHAVKPDDNFFDLGGNSLLAVKLATAMRRLNYPIGSVRDIYAHQTPEKLAELSREAQPA